MSGDRTAGVDGWEEYLGCVAGHLRAATRAITRRYDSALRPHGVRITQIAILVELRRRQPQTLSAFARALGSDRSGVARDLAILEGAGLVASSRAPDDRRARLLSLTEAGEQKLAECGSAWRAAQARVREGLGDADVTALVELADRLAGAIALDAD
jgi:DNA-binding MarR family transcriptional regulator